MLNFILELSFWKGVLLTSIAISVSGILVIVLTKRLLSPHIGKEHEKIGRLLFRVTASLIAFLISLSYANEQLAKGKIADTLEREGALLGSSVVLLRESGDVRAPKIEQQLIEYVAFTVKDDWNSMHRNPYLAEGPEALKKAYVLALEMSAENRKELMIQNKLLSNLDEIIKLMQIRVYSDPVLMPNLIYILAIGTFSMWIFYSVYKLDAISIGFITLYNIFLGVLFYFVFALSNPLIGPLKIEAHSFEIILQKGIELPIK